MKKLFASVLLLLPLAVLADDFGITVPQWKDFVPAAYINVKEPKGLARLNPNNKYWYNRKMAFDESINECSTLEANDERFNCYEKIKVSQYAQNTEYNARLEAKNTPVIPGMENPTDTMIPIGGFNSLTRNMPNEFR